MTKAVQFSNTFCYIDDLLNVNKENFRNYIGDIYPSDLELKDTTLGYGGVSQFWIASLISRSVVPYFSIIALWRLKNLVNDL